MLPLFAFSCNGFLIGLIVAFSDDQLSRIVIPLLFAVFGGSIVTFGKDLPDKLRKEAYTALLGLSLSCTIGIVVGILAVEHRWLSNAAIANSASVNESTSSDRSNKYLRSQDIKELDKIQVEVRQGQTSKDQAYDKIISVIYPSEMR